MQLDVQVDVRALQLDLERQQARLARTARRVVNAAAYQALDDVRKNMEQVFDRPTPWVKNGMFVNPARDGDLLREAVEARIEWRQFGSKSGLTAEKVLRAQIQGGERALKRFERALGLPSNRVAVPGKWAPLDGNGNIPGAFIVRVLSDLRLFGEQGYTANRVRRQDARRRGTSTRRARAARFFLIPVGGEHRSLAPGVYQYGPGGAPLLVIAFVRAARYRARFFPARVAAESAARHLPALWNQGLSGTLPFRSAR